MQVASKCPKPMRCNRIETVMTSQAETSSPRENTRIVERFHLACNVGEAASVSTVASAVIARNVEEAVRVSMADGATNANNVEKQVFLRPVGGTALVSNVGEMVFASSAAGLPACANTV